MKYSSKDLSKCFIFYFFVLGVLFVIGSSCTLICNASTVNDVPYDSSLFDDGLVDKEYSGSFAISTSLNPALAGYFDSVFYYSVSSDNEIVFFVNDGSFLESDTNRNSIGFVTKYDSSTSSMFTFSNTRFNDYTDSFVNQVVNRLEKSYLTNFATSNGFRWCGHTWELGASSDTNLSYYIDFNNCKVFDSQIHAVNYITTGSTDGLIDDGIVEPEVSNEMYFTKFFCMPYMSTDFDNVYFDFRYGLSDFLKNNISDSQLHIDITYHAVIVDKLTSKSYDFNSPYSQQLVFPLSNVENGLQTYIKDLSVFNDYIDDSVSYFGSRPSHKMKRLLIGIDDNWVNFMTDFKVYRVLTSRVHYDVYTTYNGLKSNVSTFDYDFVRNSGGTSNPEPTEPENPDSPMEPDILPSEPIPDSTDVDGNGIINSIDIRNSININIGDDDNLYYDIDPEDYNNLIDNIGNAINPQKENGLFSLLKDFLEGFPIELKLCLIGSLSAVALVSIVKILRG